MYNLVIRISFDTLRQAGPFKQTDAAHKGIIIIIMFVLFEFLTRFPFKDYNRAVTKAANRAERQNKLWINHNLQLILISQHFYLIPFQITVSSQSINPCFL